MGLQPLGLQLPLLLELAYFPFQTGLQKQKKKLKLDQRQKEVIMPLGLQVERLTTGL